MKRIGLYLDDIRTPINSNNGIQWNIVRNYEEFKTWLNNNDLPDIISFDHDLSYEHIKDMMDQADSHDDINIHYERFTEKTGLDAAKYLVQFCEDHELDLPMCTVHSANPVGADNIINYLNNYSVRNNKLVIIRRTIW